MIPNSVGFIAFFLSFLSFVGFIFTTAFWEWRRNSVQSSPAFLSQTYLAEGLWVRCNSPVPGQFNCDSYDVAFIGVARK